MEESKESEVSFQQNEDADDPSMAKFWRRLRERKLKNVKTVILSDEQKQEALADLSEYLDSNMLQWSLLSLDLGSIRQATSPRARDYSRSYSQMPMSLPVTYRACERRYVPLEINGMTTYGLPDTALIGNAMTEEWARHIGAEIEYSPPGHFFVNARGQSFNSIGTTRLNVSIPGSVSHSTTERKWTCSFAVVRQLAAPLVLGTEFLRNTEALTNLAHLLVKKTLSVMKAPLNGLRTVWRFMHMDLRTQTLKCFLDNEEAFMSLDTGSDIDVVSLDYATSRGWEIRPLPDDESHVLLANNELAKLAGCIETTIRIQGRDIFKRLFVLDGLVCDAVLGDSTIEALNIFDDFKDSIHDVREPEGADAFRMIQWIEKIDEMPNELEQLVLDGQSCPENSKRQRGWKSVFRRRTADKDTRTDDEVTQRLKGMLEEFDVCSANWRRAVEAELSTLVDEEFARKRDEIDRRKEKNQKIRDRINMNIRGRQQTSTPASSTGTPTGSTRG